MSMIKKVTHIAVCVLVMLSCGLSCSRTLSVSKSEVAAAETQKELEALLEKGDLDEDLRYAVVNQIATYRLKAKDYGSLIIFLTDWVEKHPDDKYNPYYLLMTARAYLETDAQPVARYYFERIIRNYPDLLIKGKSVHFMCLQNLIQISTTSANRIMYFNQLISQFPNDLSVTELYYRLALEYENNGEWNQALKAFSAFLKRDDAQSIQIQGRPHAYLSARQLIDFSNSSKDWTFETLDDLVTAVRTAITRYDARSLESYKSKVNFFNMSWRGEMDDENSKDNFPIRNYMRGNRIHAAAELDSSSTPTEAYLRTWGWSSYMTVWYLYFRKVNFPSDPSVHGRWEWAGIYYGEKL